MSGYPLRGLSKKGKATRVPDHKVSHFLSSDMVRDLVIGMSDGLTVPFALAAGKIPDSEFSISTS